MTTHQSVQDLAQAYGIQLDWKDIWGNTHQVDEDMCRALLSAMNVTADGPESIAREFQNLQASTVARLLDPVLVLPHTESIAYIPVHLPEKVAAHNYIWQLRTENGEIREGNFSAADLQHEQDVFMPDGTQIGKYRYALEGLPAQGYHRFTLRDEAVAVEDAVDLLLVVTPSTCFTPAILDQNAADFHGSDPEAAALSARVWGPAVQLYAVNSNRNWGIGDYTDLLKIVDWCAEKGATMLGLNPLHALFPHNPLHSSPYSPSSRMFFNVLMLDPEAIPDFAESDEARQTALSPDYQDALKKLRTEEYVNYPEVGRLKYRVLELLYTSFCSLHLGKGTASDKNYQRFVKSKGQLLEQYSLYHALQQHFYAEDQSMWGWPVWPEAYQNPKSPEVQEFLRKNPEKVGYFQYLQWQVDAQLEKVGKRCMEKNLGVGIYMDMAVGVDRGGADVWVNQHLYAQTSAVGAPPDEYNQKGQDWGLPPLIPQKMRDEQYESFIAMLRQNMHHSGALRMDHVMGLMRLFWIPPNLPPSQGAYIHYPVDELFGILALESQRNSCMVIGEDMGTVPDVVRESMQKWNVYSYKVFFFEKESEDRFKQPEEYLDTAAVAVSTHDLPTLSGFWQGQDIKVRTELDLYPTTELRERQIRDRVMERIGILNLLDQRGLLPEGMSTDPQTVPTMTAELTAAIHQLVAQTRSKVMMVQFEDMLLQTEQINLPGTTDPTYPCWKRRLTVPLDELFTDARVSGTCEKIAEERPRRGTFPEPKAGCYES